MKKSVKYLGTLAFICFLGLLYLSCVKKENYPDVPVISYDNYIAFTSGSVIDSAYLQVNFTDGNGDIGQSGPPNNFFIIPQFYLIRQHTYGPFGTDTFKYQVPNITPTGSDKELNGIIQINFESFIQNNYIDVYNNNISVLDTVVDITKMQFKVWMYDRAGNKSNVLITPTVNPYQQ